MPTAERMEQDPVADYRSPGAAEPEYKEADDERDLDSKVNHEKPSAKRDHIVHMLRRMHHDQLVDLLLPYVERDPSAYSRLVKEADSSVVFRKLFVHGLPLGTSELDFKSFFECYGQIEAVELPIPRGNTEVKYGFIVFSTVEAVHKALVNPNKWFGGKEICCKVFTVRSPSSSENSPASQQSPPGTPVPNRKIFVSGLAPDVNYNDFLMLFSQFGPVESAQIAPNKGSGYVVYAHSSSAKEAIATANKTVWNGRMLTVAWFKKRPDDETRAAARRTPLTLPQSAIAWPTASPHFPSPTHMQGPQHQWFSYPVYHQSDPIYFYPIPVAAPEIHLTMAPSAGDMLEEKFISN